MASKVGTTALRLWCSCKKTLRERQAATPAENGHSGKAAWFGFLLLLFVCLFFKGLTSLFVCF